jgi:hypothetical protein
LSRPLIVPEPQLAGHFRKVSAILDSVVDARATVVFDPDWDQRPVVAGLQGQGCEFIVRNRGSQTAVAPLLQLQGGLWAWISYREEWDSEKPSGRTRRFCFRSSGATIYFGCENDAFKAQMFRAEWAGWAKWSGGSYGFQAANAGHPHWQFDALDSLSEADLGERAELLLERLEDGPEAEVRNFQPERTQKVTADAIRDQKLSKVHFASAALWWKPPPQNAHTHGPTTVQDVQNWLQCSMRYLITELQRL